MLAEVLSHMLNRGERGGEVHRESLISLTEVEQSHLSGLRLNSYLCNFNDWIHLNSGYLVV